MPASFPGMPRNAKKHPYRPIRQESHIWGRYGRTGPAQTHTSRTDAQARRGVTGARGLQPPFFLMPLFWKTNAMPAIDSARIRTASAILAASGSLLHCTQLTNPASRDAKAFSVSATTAGRGLVHEKSR